MKVVYVDVLFLINLCMDFLALRISGGVLHLPARRLPLLFASFLGGAYAVMAALYPGNAAIGAVIGFLTAVLLCVIAYGGVCRYGLYPWLFALFYGTSWLLGGMIGAFYGFLERFFVHRQELLTALTEGDGKIAFFFATVVSVGVIFGLLRGRLSAVRQERSVSLRLTVGNASREVLALVDSGNFLRDPLSGRPCLLITRAVAKGLLPPTVIRFAEEGAKVPSSLGEAGRRIRLIPADSVGGHTLLVGYLPDRVEILTDKTAKATDAVIVFADGHSDFSGYGALIPSILI